MKTRSTGWGLKMKIAAILLMVFLITPASISLCYANTDTSGDGSTAGIEDTVTDDSENKNESEGEALPEPITANEPVTISIPLKYEIENEKSIKDKISTTFTLTAVNENNPMPDGKIGGSKTVTMNGSGTIDFGEITYITPDAYTYTVTRSSTGIKYLTEDNTEYEITVCALSTGEGNVIVKIKGEDEKSELLYKDIYDAPAAKTGDEQNLLHYLNFFFISAALLLMMFAGNMKKNDRIDDRI